MSKMPWPKFSERLSREDVYKKEASSDHFHVDCVLVPEAEARELWEMKQRLSMPTWSVPKGAQVDVLPGNVVYVERDEEMEKLRAALRKADLMFQDCESKLNDAIDLLYRLVGKKDGKARQEAEALLKGEK